MFFVVHCFLLLLCLLIMIGIFARTACYLYIALAMYLNGFFPVSSLTARSSTKPGSRRDKRNGYMVQRMADYKNYKQP